MQRATEPAATPSIGHAAPSPDSVAVDPLAYRQALLVARSRGAASAHLLQRHQLVGPVRAARLFAALREAAGVPRNLASGLIAGRH